MSRRLLAEVEAKNPVEPEFHQAVQELPSPWPSSSTGIRINRHAKILERIIEPERVLHCSAFLAGRSREVQINPAFRIEDEQRQAP